jgi:hypothetical protein
MIRFIDTSLQSQSVMKVYHPLHSLLDHECPLLRCDELTTKTVHSLNCLDWRLSDESLSTETESESEPYVTPDGQSDSLSWNKAPIWGLRPDFYYC